MAIVDDSPASREILDELITSFGAVTTAVGSRDAATLLGQPDANSRPFDLVLLDAECADEDSLELAARLLEQQTYREHQLVVMLPIGHTALAQRCRQLGLERCASKPIKHSELLDLAGGLPDHSAAERPATETAARERTLRILLAEDGVINQEVAVGLLDMRGHQVHIANNGQEAVEAYFDQTFDVIITDIEMPVMDGFQVARQIREAEAGADRHIPIVAMTAHAVQGFRDRCFEAGMDAYISKPIQPDELFGVLDQFK